MDESLLQVSQQWEDKFRITQNEQHQLVQNQRKFMQSSKTLCERTVLEVQHRIEEWNQASVSKMDALAQEIFKKAQSSMQEIIQSSIPGSIGNMRKYVDDLVAHQMHVFEDEKCRRIEHEESKMASRLDKLESLAGLLNQRMSDIEDSIQQIKRESRMQHSSFQTTLQDTTTSIQSISSELLSLQRSVYKLKTPSPQLPFRASHSPQHLFQTTPSPSLQHNVHTPVFSTSDRQFISKLNPGPPISAALPILNEPSTVEQKLPRPTEGTLHAEKPPKVDEQRLTCKAARDNMPPLYESWKDVSQKSPPLLADDNESRLRFLTPSRVNEANVMSPTKSDSGCYDHAHPFNQYLSGTHGKESVSPKKVLMRPSSVPVSCFETLRI
eukprot:TRINITY_DN4483_c0_g1_i2.p1 TRINITY_DN4483_c0_g1~~TRINITY_DN4483_c0_g1_i2.p1  ORF type:complete len:392 (-),score=86.34 TRINITY_DN4483_c0_g1_i2:124-1269(-)